MAYSGKAVANEFLSLAREEGCDLTNMKLQKLLYFAHGWHLASAGQPLLRDKVEAWKFGPVVPQVYHEFKRFGTDAIKARALRVTETGPVAPRITREDTKTIGFLKKIWGRYKGFSGVQLSNLTHLEGTPWYIAWHNKGGKDRLGQDIDDEDIKSYFKGKIDAA